LSLFQNKQTIFTQGDLADAVFYVQTGKVRLTVVSKTGKEAAIGMLAEGDFSAKVHSRVRLPIRAAKNVRIPSAWLADKESWKIQRATSSLKPETSYASSLLKR